MEASRERPAPTPNVESSEITVASTKCNNSETLVRLDAKAVIAKSLLITNVPTQRENSEVSTSAFSKSPTQQPHYEHGRGLTPNETGKGFVSPTRVHHPTFGTKGKEQQNDSNGNGPTGPSMGSMNEKLYSKESSGSSSDGGKGSGSLESELRRRGSTAASSISPTPLPTRFENVQPPAAAKELNDRPEVDTEDNGPVIPVGQQVVELDGTSLRRDRSDKALSTNEAPSNNGITVQNASATTNVSITPDTANAVRVGNLWVLPEAPLQYSRLAVYNENLKPSVDWLLRCSKGSTKPQGEKAFAEVLMARRNDFDDFAPTVVFCSRIPKRRQQIANFLRDGVLKEQFVNFGLSWSIEDADESSISFLGSIYANQTWTQASEHQSQRKFSVDIGSLPMKTKVCGARILVQEEYLGDDAGGQSIAMMTIGGIIMVDDKPYGLSVAHPVSTLNSQKSEWTNFEASWELDHDVHNELGEKQDNNTFASYEAFAEGSHWPRTHLFRSLGSISAFAYSNQQESVDVAKNSDWTLISVEPDMILPNLIPRESGSSLQLIQDIVTQAELPRGELENGAELPCTIVTAHGAIQGRLSPGSSLLEINGSSFQAKRIELGHPLERGDSGSWVLFDGRLCGSLIAGRDHPPCAYMVPIEDIFNSVIQSMSATRVSLPSKIDSRLFELNLAAHETGLIYPEVFLLRAYKQQHSRASRPKYDSILPSKDLLLIYSAMQGHNTLREFYDHVTGLDLSTLNGLILLGEVCTAEESFLLGLRENMLRRTVLVSLNPHLLEIRHQLLKTRAGESLLALIFFTKTLPVESQAALFREMLGMLNIPYSLIPSIPRIRKLVKHCRFLLSRVERGPEMEILRLIKTLDVLVDFGIQTSIRNFASLVLQLAEVTKCNKSKILIYGGSLVQWAKFYATVALGLNCTVYGLQSGGGYNPDEATTGIRPVWNKIVEPTTDYATAEKDPHVRLYYGPRDQVCELLDTPEPSALRSLDVTFSGLRDNWARDNDQQENWYSHRLRRETTKQIPFPDRQGIGGPLKGGEEFVGTPFREVTDSLGSRHGKQAPIS